MQTLTITTTEGRTVTLTPVSVVSANGHGISIIVKENAGPLETGWQSAKVFLAARPVSVQGNSLTVTKVVDGAGPVIARAQYRSGVTGDASDTIIITASELIDCAMLTSNKPSSIFVLYDEGGKNTEVLNNATILGGCPSKYTSLVTMIVKNKALLTPLDDSIAFAGQTDAVVDQSGNNPSVNNRAVRFEWGIKNEVIIGISNNPFIPGKTPIPSIVIQNYAEALNGNTIGVVISIYSTIALEADGNGEYGQMILYDAVGNVVMANLPLIKVTSEKYGIYWDGRNHNKRRVGTGAYLGVITFTNIQGARFIEKIKIGVK